MELQITDGGRKEAGFDGKTRDCSVRAIAIVCGIPYSDAWDLVKRFTVHSSSESPSKGIKTKTMGRILSPMGFEWIPTIGIGTGCKVHLRDGEIPRGCLIVRLSKHFTCVINGTVHDDHDPRRNGNRCVYGYWIKNGNIS